MTIDKLIEQLNEKLEKGNKAIKVKMGELDVIVVGKGKFVKFNDEEQSKRIEDNLKPYKHDTYIHRSKDDYKIYYPQRTTSAADEGIISKT